MLICYVNMKEFSVLIFHRFFICILNYTLHFVWSGYRVTMDNEQWITDNVLENYLLVPFPFF